MQFWLDHHKLKLLEIFFDFPEKNTKYSAYERFILLPCGLMIVNKIEEDKETEKPESSETCVVNYVEDCDEEPALWGPAHNCTCFLEIKTDKAFNLLTALNL